MKNLLDDTPYASPRWTWEILDCAMPMTFDTYSNCAFQCAYCFSFFQRAIGTRKDDYLHHVVRAVDIAKIKKMFTDPDQYAGSFAWYIKSRMVLQWGGLSDGFDWYERKLRKSLELLRFFREIDYPVSISTKGTWFMHDPEYVEVFRDAKNVHLKVSIITANKDHAAVLESGTSSPAERFRLLEWAKKVGVPATTWRFRPFIIGTSDVHLEEGYVMAKEAGVDNLTTEFLCLERRASGLLMQRVKAMSELLGYDVWNFYVKNSARRTGLMRLSYDLKRPYIDRMLELSAKYGLPLFISDAHHKEKSAGTGCCGLPETGPLSNMNRGQYAEAILLAKKNGSVRWSEIDALAQPLKNIPFKNNHNSGTLERAQRMYQTMYEFMRSTWNDPESHNSPARYFGGALVPTSTDENGDVVYTYNKPYVETGYRVASVNELADIMERAKTAQGEDGRRFGHVAYPVYVLGEDPALIGLLGECKLNATLVVSEAEAEAVAARHPEMDVITGPPAEDAVENGYGQYWLLRPGLSLNGDASLRAMLSRLEEAHQQYSAPLIDLVLVEATHGEKESTV